MEGDFFVIFSWASIGSRDPWELDYRMRILGLEAQVDQL